MRALLLCAAALALTGCATYYPAGAFFTQGTMGVQADSGKGNKTGRACMKSYLGMIATGDASIDAAKRAGNISKVSTINYEVNNVLGIVGEYCLVVTGD